MQKQIQRFHLLGRGDETTCIVISYQFRHSIKNLPSSAARGKNPPIPNEPNEGKARYDTVCSDPKGKFSERILSVWHYRRQMKAVMSHQKTFVVNPNKQGIGEKSPTCVQNNFTP